MPENPIYVTVAGAGNKSGSTWGNAMGRAEWETDLEAPASPDDTYYVEEGTYTLSEDIDNSAIDGTSTAPIKIIGVKSGTSNEPPVFADHAFTTARPLIEAAGWMWKFGDYWIFKNLRVTTTEATGFQTGANCLLINCASNNSSGTSGRRGFTLGAVNNVIGCEAQSINGQAFRADGSNNKFVGCYAHDSDYGFHAASGRMDTINSIADTCTIAGINIDARSDSQAINNTIYNCAIGIRGTSAVRCLIVNNIIDACTIGASWTTNYPSNYFDYNCWDNTTDTVNITKGDNAVTGDPGMGNPANGDFSIDSESNCVDAALDAGDLTGATV